MFLHEDYKREFIREDTTSLIPLASITGSSIEEDKLLISSPGSNWMIYVSSEAMSIIQTGVQMAQVGQLAAPKFQDSRVEILNLIKELGKLRDQGVITEEDFNKKKNDLLSKL